MKVLMISQNQTWLEQLAAFFKKNRINTEIVSNLRTAYQKLNNYEYDCVLADVKVVGDKCVNFADVLRKDNPSTGILFFGQGLSTELHIALLEAGVDDVIRQPAIPEEVYARMKAVLRRYPQVASREIVIDGLIIRPDEYGAFTDEGPIELTKKEFEILAYLARNRNRIVNKDGLAEYLWGEYSESADSYDFLYAHIKNLRRKLAKRGYSDYIKTIYGVGYRLI